MELKVWVEGIQRIVCGVSDSTTCQDVVFALAHAIGKSGKFTLIERWRNNERLLSPTEKPLKVLLKWGEYSNDVQFILQCNVSCPKTHADISTKLQHTNKTNRCHIDTNRTDNCCISDVSTNNLTNGNDSSETKDFSESQYKDLIDIVNFQKKKISLIEADLKNINTEIEYWETRNKEQCFQIDYISKEIINIEHICQMNDEQIQALSYLENESEMVKHQEKSLKVEIITLRSKLSKSETELLQYKNKIQLLNEDLLIDQRKLQKSFEQEKISRNNNNVSLDVEALQKDIEEAKRKSDLHNEVAEALKYELMFMESAIREKKKQIENLISEMKEANLRSLLMNPADEVRYLLENLSKTGTNRRIVGSPRQLESAVPTNKNPHGVWV